MAADQPRQQQQGGISRYDILLVGGGHAQLAVLEDWIANGVPAASAALVTPSRWLRYSGTVPGIVSGEFSPEHGRVDLAALCARARIELIEDRLTVLDPNGRIATLGSGAQLAFGMCSIDTGGKGRAGRVLGESERLLDIRPIERFLDTWSEFAQRIGEKRARIAVVGGGAGGVEIAFAIRNAAGFTQAPEVTLYAGRDGLLPQFAAWPRSLIAQELARQGIAIFGVDACFDNGELLTGGDAASAPGASFDIVVAAIGSGAPRWPHGAGLAVYKSGFIAVDRHQRSLSHPHILASGDVAHRIDRRVDHAGVHAVHTGPVLADNLRRIAQGFEPQRVYRPRPASLYLLSTGRGEAIMAYGPLAAKGRWAAKWKQRIDNRWLAQYARLGQQG